ncbi:MAG: hypothetical protein ACD_78C00068G0002 [uncultured bacterium (gcode 4)]|uniref:Ribonuclease R n=1 Tax=uncultured bacterium (gcode 4) TaxID=1234023 RepID=K1YDR7_9BACT|nr:MAG: hypothetical protein ACD_78C00068G0002 [uncultured bacterium (gcode 4)]
MNSSYHTGIYSQIQPHFWFVETLEGEVFFVGKRERNGALDGDTVKVQVTKQSADGKKAEAKVIELVKRTEKVLVGRYIKRPKSTYGFVQVIEGFGGKDIFVGDRDALGAKNDEIVTIRVFGDKNKPHGKVVSVLGHKESPGMAERIVFHENGIIKEFPRNVVAEAEKIAMKYDPNFRKTEDFQKGSIFGAEQAPKWGVRGQYGEWGAERQVEKTTFSKSSRIDLRSEWIITIDGTDAKDLDDAISVKKLPNGNFELGVHIADVAEYVTEDSVLDREAYHRGTSIYTPDEVIPMLPEHLSNNLCSLHPGSAKATLSITLELDKTGKVLHSRIDETLIDSKQRFTYDEVQEIIDELDGKKTGIFEKYPREIIELLRNGLELKRILDKRRAREGKIDFDLKEVKITTDAAGKVVDISKRDRSESHKVIEEFMILANEEVSRFFSEKKIPFLYRVHEKPSEEKADELIALLDHYGYNLSREMLSPRSLREIMDTLHEKDYYFVLSKQILGSMSKAIYSEEILGHFGLALHYYSHFTSPIRRYPDLQIHRIIKAYIHKKLDKKELVRFAGLLPKVAKHTSTTERKAESIEYLIRDIKIIDYMQDKIGQIFDGMVSSIGDHGIYVELPNGIEGLVYMRDMRSTHHFDERAGTLKSLSGGKTYRLGDPIRVRVIQADKTLRRLDFEVVK